MDLPSIPVDEARTDSEVKHIGIVGAGPAGLAALKAVLDSPQCKAGLWRPVVFEAREDVGGVWLPSQIPRQRDVPPPTPLYDSLTTNLPHPIMAYSSFSFPPETPLFPPAETVETYLRAYAAHFDLRTHIRFRTRVTDVVYDGEAGKWILSTSPESSSSVSADPHTPAESKPEPSKQSFDLLLICNGHHNVPRYPNTSGLASWLAARRASHSVFYRSPAVSGAPYPLNASHKVLVVGGGPSGQDVVADLEGVVKCVIHAASAYSPVSGGGEVVVDEAGGNLKRRGRPMRFTDVDEGKVEFEGGVVEDGIDYCILATGYEVSFPFFRSADGYVKEGLPPPIPPLPKEVYNTSYGVFPLVRHLFPFPSSSLSSHSQSTTPSLSHPRTSTPPPTSIAFLGLLVRVAPLPLIEAQARAALAAFAHPDRVDWTREAIGVVERYRDLEVRLGLGIGSQEGAKREEEKIQKAWCHFEPMEQFDYRDALGGFVDELELESADRPEGRSNANATRTPAGIPHTKGWERELYARKDVLRRTWRALEANGEARDWVRNVGFGHFGSGSRSSGKSAEEEWVDLMWRVVRRGEGAGDVESEDEKARL